MLISPTAGAVEGLLWLRSSKTANVIPVNGITPLSSNTLGAMANGYNVIGCVAIATCEIRKSPVFAA